MPAPNPFHLPIPPRPKGQEPRLHPGWQWADVAWLAYWLMEYQGIQNRPQHLELPCSRIRAMVETLRWWEATPFTQGLFRRILNARSTFEASHRFNEWLAQEGLLSPPYKAEIEKGVYLQKNDVVSRRALLQGWLGDPPVFVADRRQFGRGRHRTYAAWRCGLSQLFVYVP